MKTDDTRLDRKVAIVTGAASGIGREMRPPSPALARSCPRRREARQS